MRLVGDYVAFVVAETHHEARDAAETIEVDYAPLPSVTATADALAEGAPAVWPEAPDNVCFVYEQGDENAVEQAFARADRVTRLDFIVTRVAVAPMEPRACIGEFDRFTQRYTLYTGTQGPHGVRMATASPILKVPEGDLRVVSHDMGGAFGMRSGPYCEYTMCLFASKMLGRPVKWTGDRAEGFMVDDQARDNISTAELALAADGEFLGFRVRTTANLGAYLTLLGPHSSTNNLGSLAGPYRTPAIYTHVTGVFTNTVSTGPYRGAGRPRLPTRSSGSSIPRRTSWASIRPSSGGATTSPRKRSRSRPASSLPTIPASSRPTWIARWRWWITRTATPAGQTRNRAASCSGSAFPT